MKRTVLAALAGVLCSALAPLASAQAPKPAYAVLAVKQGVVRTSAGTIAAARLKNYLTFVASDEMEGRATPSRGLDTTARFLAMQLERWGVKPAGDDGTYYQKIALEKQKVVADGTEIAITGRKFSYGRDFVVSGPARSVSGAMVFAGDGWFVKAKDLDPYKSIDPKGKVVIVTQSAMPAGLTQAEAMKILMGGKRGEDWMDPAAYAQKKGAVGVVLLQNLFTLANPDAMDAVRKSAEEGTYQPVKLPASARSALPTVVPGLPIVQAIFARERTDARAVMMSFPTGTPIQPFELSAEKTITITINATTEQVTSQNVVAIIEGSDPVLKAEYVALGAHYDHVGTGTPVKGDSIRNGADDDGTGTVGLLSMAEALSGAARRPKRSVLFVWHMGEERGMWGSKYFTAFPTVPIDKIVVQLNIDMIGRTKRENDANPRNKDLSGPDEVYVIGSKMMSTELGAISEAVNEAYLKLKFNYKYDDPKDPQRFFYRSDHYHYAVRNIPVIFYFTGEHVDYHQTSDEVSQIDFQKFEKVARTIYATLWEIGEMKARPKVDKELPAEARQGMF